MRRNLLASMIAVFLAAADAPPEKPMRITRAPEFEGVTDWVNSPPLTIAGLRGKVVVVHFWTHGCYNCVNNYPHYKAWLKRYEGKDVAFIGIHTPETPGERNVDEIRKQAAKNGLTFPIAVDNDGKNWRNWKNQYWPTVYLVDRQGRVRQGWEGELNYKGQKGEESMRKAIDALLKEKAGR